MTSDTFDFVTAYEAHANALLEAQNDPDRALELAVGSTQEEFYAVGEMQKDLLVAQGLRTHSSLVEIGCGSGRLAAQLLGWLAGPYLGTDVVQVLLDRAATLANAPNIRFERVTGLSVPIEDASADMVCAFSVFTHLLHEQSFVYMRDCFRVLKPGGRLVFSYLEFRVPSHWAVMEGNVQNVSEGSRVLNQFMSVDAIEAWAEHLNFEVVDIFRGDIPFIPLGRAVSLNGIEFRELGTFGQSAAVLAKPATR